MPGVGGHLRRYRQKEGCMMNHSMEILCVVWWEKLAATHPDDLFPSEQQALERHVASCQACAAVRAEYQTIDALLLAGEDLEPLPVLSTQLLQPRKGPAHVPTMSELPRTMRLSALADRCMSEIDNYRRGEESNDQYCLELVGRSVSRIFTGCISSSSQERGRVPPGQPRELRGEGLCTFLECSS